MSFPPEGALLAAKAHVAKQREAQRPHRGNASKLSKGPSGSLLFVQCRLDQLSFGHRGQAIANAAARV
ncbi:MAG: hypothetical protein ACK4OH_12565, partial [Acidovorax temperans]|uniref:hypothetical protein n=1 Tax=Acidovorax temperans TaxID=80878 RepID=UPI00391DBBE5